MLNSFIYIFSVLFLTYYIQTEKIFEKLFFTDFLKELRKCAKCLGFWVALGMYAVFGEGILTAWMDNNHPMNVIITAISISTIAFYIRLGIQYLHGYHEV